MQEGSPAKSSRSAEEEEEEELDPVAVAKKVGAGCWAGEPSWPWCLG